MAKWVVFVNCPMCDCKLTAWIKALCGEFKAESNEKHWVFDGSVFCPYAELWAVVDNRRIVNHG